VPWFRLDQGFHSHPKIIAAGNEAIGLYARCGTYAAEHSTDGFIREDIAVLYGASDTGSRRNPGTGKPETLAETLVRTMLWRRTRGGWTMPDYLDYNPSKQAVDKERKQAAERQRRRRDAVMSQRESRRDYGRESRPSVPVRPGLDVVVDVVNRSNGQSRARDPAVIDAIIKEIHDQTGTLIEPGWAQRVADLLLTPGVTHPAAYVRACIRADPNPGLRFLPQNQPPRHARKDPDD
jgi:hypothetical protein